VRPCWASGGKNTVYRRWPNKDALLVDAVATLNPPMPEPTGADTRDDMIMMLSPLITRLQDARATSILNGMMAAGKDFPQLRERYYADVVEPRREALRRVLRAGVASGELRPGIDPEAIGNMLTAPLIYHSIEGTMPQGTPAEIAAEVVDVILFGIARDRG
jgi:AcrR family transcriptional regulator